MDKLYFNCYLPSGKEKWVTRDEKTPRKPLIVEQNTPKKPLSEAPRRGGKTNQLNQKLLQVSGEVTQCDPHPVYEELFYGGNETNGKQRWVTEEHWKNKGITTPTEIHEKQRAAREYNLTKPDSEPRVIEGGTRVGCVDQQSMQVSWKPKKGDVHPKYPNFRYFSKHPRDGSQMWFTLEAFNKKKEQDKEWRQTPEGRAKAAESQKRFIEKNPEKANKGFIYHRAYRELEEGVITKEDYDKVCELGKLQAALNAGLDKEDEWHLDHIIPETHGGLTTVQNLQMVPAKWNMSKGNRNRHVMAHNGSDCDIWYRTPYVYPKTREWTHSLPKSGIKELTYQKPPEHPEPNHQTKHTHISTSGNVLSVINK
jgi:hypothetical protein